MKDKNPFLASMRAAARGALANRPARIKSPPVLGAVDHPHHITKPSDYIAPENMSLGLRLDEITPSASGGPISAKLRDKLRRKHGLKT